MNGRKLVLGAVAAFLVMFALSWVWHEVLMGDFYRSGAPAEMRETPLFWAVGLGYLVLALLMAWLYPRGYEGGPPLGEGARFGAVIGLVWILPVQLVLYGVLGGTLTFVAVDAGWHVVEQAIGGIVLATVYGGAAEPAAEAPAARPSPGEGEAPPRPAAGQAPQM